MTKQMLYLIGEPGVGKTTISQMMFEGLPSKVKSVPYVTWTEYHPTLCELGRQRENFGGTDALSMAAQKKVIAWLENESNHPYVFGEGDRLANAKFFNWAQEHFELQIACIWGPEIAEERRNARAAELGKEQNTTWLASRRTKIERLVEEFVPDRLVFDAKRRPDYLANAILRNTDVGSKIKKLRHKRGLKA